MFSLPEIDESEIGNIHIDVDELFERKRLRDLRQLQTFEKMLANIHKKIRIASRQTTYLWVNIPETMPFSPKYNQAECIAYVMDKLQKDKLTIDFYLPSWLFITWHNIYPSYVRQEIKNKLNIDVDEYGNIIKKMDEEMEEEEDVKPKSKFKSVKTYKPSRTLYDDELLYKLQDRFKK